MFPLCCQGYLVRPDPCRLFPQPLSLPFLSPGPSLSDPASILQLEDPMRGKPSLPLLSLKIFPWLPFANQKGPNPSVRLQRKLNGAASAHCPSPIPTTFPSHPGSSRPELLAVPQTRHTLTYFMLFTQAIPSPWNAFPMIHLETFIYPLRLQLKSSPRVALAELPGVGVGSTAMACFYGCLPYLGLAQILPSVLACGPLCRQPPVLPSRVGPEKGSL